MTRILLTGASGTVGHETLKHLLRDKNNQVTVFDLKNRKSKKIFDRLGSSISVIYGDIRNMDSLGRACKNQDAIIHLAAIIPPYADDYPDLANSINHLGCQNLVHCLEESSPAAFLIYGSSISVYGDRLEDKNISVDDQLCPSVGDEYAKTKIKAEEVIKSSSLNYCIFRMTAVMGATNHKISKLMFHMPLNTAFEIITPDDTGRAFANAIHKKAALNSKIFNLGGGEKCRIIYRELLGRAFRDAGLGKMNFPINSFANHNFHCGYYIDGDVLENILHFRRESVEDFFVQHKSSYFALTRLLAKVFRWPIKQLLIKQSEPLRAFNTKNKDLLRFFKEPDKKAVLRPSSGR